ncbi:unnamed protein product [Blepharisma stoltei]|uniref:Protein TIC 214 n=1 Tax=Blepharisma stoltei TaxID=1481888 RepID=A0AAU9JY17_9CILI|nr:unnamed protein product [Blepharisma stoltei]
MEYMSRPYASGRSEVHNRKLVHARQKAASKLYRILEMKLFVDARLVKRFRIWQIHIIKGGISRFLKNIRRTNVKYMTSRLKVIMKILNKPTREFFLRLANHTSQIKIPSSLLPNIGACKIIAYLNKKQAKARLTSIFKILPNITERKSLIKIAFNLWMSLSFNSSPFLHRPLVLTLQILCIILNKNNRLKQIAWDNIKRKNYLSKGFPLLRTLQILVNKRFKFSIGKLAQPRFQIRRRWEDPQIAESYKKRALNTAGALMESMIRRKMRIEQIESIRSLSISFTLWKKRTTISLAVPSFIKKRQTRQWSLALIKNSLQAVIYRNKLQSFRAIRTKTLIRKEYKGFEIDKAIIKNQAMINAQLEKQLEAKIEESHKTKRSEKVKCLNFIFKTHLREVLYKWASIVGSEKNNGFDVGEIFEYLSYLEEQAQATQDVEIDEEMSELRAMLERKSVDQGFEGMESEQDQDYKFKSV